jgi:hypothetical protein
MSRSSPAGAGKEDGKGLVSNAGRLTRLPGATLAFMLIEYHDVYDTVNEFLALRSFQILSKALRFSESEVYDGFKNCK